jgi:hypothetical protein
MLTGMALTAHADVETFSVTVPPSGTLAVPFTQPFNLPLFDPSLGTLTGVNIQFAYSITPTLRVRNTDTNVADPDETFTAGAVNATIGLTGPDATSTSAVAGVTGLSGSVPATQTINFPGSTVTGSTNTNIAPANFGTYTGPAGSFGTFTAFANSLSAGGTGGGFNGGGDLFYNGLADVSGTGTVTYTFTAPAGTPEPGTWAMMMAGASTGLVALRRRRRNKK